MKSLASGLSGISRSMTQRTALTVFNRISPIAMGRSLLQEGSDGFVPVMVAATLVASAVLLALD
jgi:hypothetical protein